MATRAHVALLWHMHQPLYRDPVKDVVLLPMVFLHAVKDYYDMIRLAERHPAVRMTVNFVPVLLSQLEDCEKGCGKDLFLRTLLCPVEELDEAERGNMIPLLFMANEKRMILPLPRYYDLYQKRERMGARTAAGALFDDQEFLDLTVLFLLAWTGTFIREEEPLVQELLRKGSGYSQGAKEELVRLLGAKVSLVPGLYRRAQEEGRIELTTTPFYHPILPLLFDMRNARAVERDLALPVVTSSLAADSSLHLDRALACHGKAFGRPCRGVWPAEGALSFETMELFAQRGVAWTATDEEVLAHSLALDLSHFPDRRNLYRPWTFSGASGQVAVFFRDRVLSDLIGFSFQRWEARSAVAHLVSRLQEIRESLPWEGVVPVILDGENAWEHYHNNGRPFLELLYQELSRAPGLVLSTFSEALAAVSPAPLPRLVPGSWIGGRLSTWVGHPEKNTAWEVLAQTRETLLARKGEVPKKDWAAAEEELLASEGSDWFWWFGDDHFSTISDRFDELFRLHLQNVHRFLGMRPPTRLLEPIKKTFAVGHLRAPVGPVIPVLDGKVTDYFEWVSAGAFDLLYEQGTMHRTGGILHQLYYGFSDGALNLRVDSDRALAESLEGLQLVVDVVSPAPKVVTLSVGAGGLVTPDLEAAASGVAAAVAKVAEVSIPLAYIGAGKGTDVGLALEVRRGKESLERAPAFSLVKLRVPEDYNLENWIV